MADKVTKVYRPDYNPVDPDLNRSVAAQKEAAQAESFEVVRARAEREVARLKRIRTDGGSANRPAGDNPRNSRLRPALTFEEAVAVEAQKDEMLAQIKATRLKVKDTQNRIDEMLRGDGTDLSFDVDLKRRPNLRRAVAKAFGIENPSTISYSMYKAALAARRQLEKQEADDYTSGNWGEEEGS